jgi:hypothetical protein
MPVVACRLDLVSSPLQLTVRPRGGAPYSLIAFWRTSPMLHLVLLHVSPRERFCPPALQRRHPTRYGAPCRHASREPPL